MTIYSYTDPGPNGGFSEHFYNEEMIINEYWDYWVSMMEEAGKPESELTHQNCINDWVALHWATQHT